MTKISTNEIRNPAQLKSMIKKIAKDNKMDANTVLQNYMMERFLERISLSKYCDNFILKGGYLIAAMIGINMRSTMDMDTTIKGLAISKQTIHQIIKEIALIELNDNLKFELESIKSIHEVGDYENFRIVLLAVFSTVRVRLKLDITTGDIVLPNEIDYSYKLMFEEREILIKAYNFNTIISEKIETILARNILNSRMRDFYDVYILLTTQSYSKSILLDCIYEKQKREEH